MKWGNVVSVYIVVFLVLGGIIGCDQEYGVRGPVNPAHLLMNVGQEGTGTVHAILVADTNADDIRPSVEADLANMNAFVENVAGQTGLHLNKQVLADDAVTRSAVEMAVKDVSAGRNDVVIFYYAGRGKRPSERKARWPRMSFSNDANDPGMDLNEIFVVLSRKNPSLLLVLSDPRNVFDDSSIAIPEEPEEMPAIHEERAEAYRRLFLINRRGLIIAAGIRPDEDGVGNVLGGSFTQQFLQVLHQNLSSEQPLSWRAIMTQATAPLGTTQHPHYVVY